jgi:hypothetical protein
LKRVQSTEPLHAKMNPTSYLFGSPFACAQTAICPQNRAPKMRETHQLFFGLRLMSKEFHHPAIQTKIEQHFGEYFHQIKVREPTERQDSLQTVIRTSRRLDSFLHEAAQNFEVFSNIQEYNSHVDPIWPDGTCKVTMKKSVSFHYCTT